MQTITDGDVLALLNQFYVQYPGFSLVMKATASRRCTTWDKTIYVPGTWQAMSPAQKYVRLVHESAHLEQFSRMSPWTFGLRYTTPWGRTELEHEAYAAEFVAMVTAYGPATLLAKRDYYIELFTGKAYFWCDPWPGRAAAWVDTMMAAVIAQEGSGGNKTVL